MSTFGRKVQQWGLAVADAANVLRSGQILGGSAVRHLQSLTDALLRHSSITRGTITPGTQESDAFLQPRIAALEGADRAAAAIACLHALSVPLTRHAVFESMPETFPSSSRFGSDLFAYLEAVIQGRQIYATTFRKFEASAAAGLQRVLVHEKEGTEELFQSIWESLYWLGRPGTSNSAHGVGNNQADEHGDPHSNLFPDRLVFWVLTPEKGRILRDKLDSLLLQKDLVMAHKLVYGLHKICHFPRSRHVLATVFPDYQMWLIWNPCQNRIHQWSESRNEGLRRHWDRLKPFFALEGPDISGDGGATLRQSTPTNYFNELLRPPDGRNSKKLPMLECLLTALDVAIRTGPSSVELLVQLLLAGPQHPIDNKVIERLEEALRLGNDAHCGALARYVQVVRGGGQEMKTYDRVVAVAKALPVIGATAPLRARWGVDFGIGTLAPNLFRQSQQTLCGELLPQGLPCEPFARAVWDLGRGLADSTWLHGRWTQTFLGILHGIPELWKIQRSLDAMAIPTIEYDEYVQHVAFLIDALGRDEGTISRSGSAPGPRPALVVPLGHRASTSSYDAIQRRRSGGHRGLSSPWPLQYSQPSAQAHDLYDDPVWHRRYLSAEEEVFKARIQNVPDIPDELATRCMRQALNERSQHLESISERLFKLTDQSCVGLSIYLHDLNSGGLLKNPCWADLLLHVTRVRHLETHGLLDHLADDPTLSSERFGRWLEALRQVLGSRFVNLEGQMGFSAGKIEECEGRISRRRSVNAGDLGRLPTRYSGRRTPMEVDPVFTPSGPISASTPGTSIRSYFASPSAGSACDGEYLPPSPDRPFSQSLAVSESEEFDEKGLSIETSSFSRQDSQTEDRTEILTGMPSKKAVGSTSSSSFHSSQPSLPL